MCNDYFCDMDPSGANKCSAYVYVEDVDATTKVCKDNGAPTAATSAGHTSHGVAVCIATCLHRRSTLMHSQAVVELQLLKLKRIQLCLHVLQALKSKTSRKTCSGAIAALRWWIPMATAGWCAPALCQSYALWFSPCLLDASRSFLLSVVMRLSSQRGP